MIKFNHKDFIKLIINFQLSGFHCFVLVILLLDLGLSACSSKEHGLNFYYPTVGQEIVHELWALVSDLSYESVYSGSIEHQDSKYSKDPLGFSPST